MMERFHVDFETRDRSLVDPALEKVAQPPPADIPHTDLRSKAIYHALDLLAKQRSPSRWQAEASSFVRSKYIPQIRWISVTASKKPKFILSHCR